MDNQLRAGQSRRNVQKMRVVLSAILSNAMAEERIVRNVARSVKLPAYKPKEVIPWDVDQLATFLRAAADHPILSNLFLNGLLWPP